MHLSGIETAQTTGAALMISALFAFLAQWLIVQKINLKPEQFVRLGLLSLLAATIFVERFQDFSLLGVGMAFMKQVRIFTAASRHTGNRHCMQIL